MLDQATHQHPIIRHQNGWLTANVLAILLS